MAKKQSTAPSHEQEFTIRIYTSDLRNMVLERVSEAVSNQFDSVVSEAVRAAVEERVEQFASAEIKAAVLKVLEEGWDRTDEYGGRRGTATLKDRISELLNAQDRYGNSRRWAEKIVQETTEKALREELKQEIDAARQKLRAEVDAVTRAKLNEVLRQALGVS